MDIVGSVTTVLMFFLPGYITILITQILFARSKNRNENHEYKDFDNKLIFIPRIVAISGLIVVIPYTVLWFVYSDLCLTELWFNTPIDLIGYDPLAGFLITASVFLIMPFILALVIRYGLDDKLKEVFLGHKYHNPTWERLCADIIGDYNPNIDTNPGYVALVTLNDGTMIYGGFRSDELQEFPMPANFVDDLLLDVIYEPVDDDDDGVTLRRNPTLRKAYVSGKDILSIAIIMRIDDEDE